tara:strand:- start:6980 stop:9085 length:2106 start_codon:yes stop_codon:yes gene_type:complete
MPNAVIAYNNFARGKIDHDMMGRYDLPIYSTAADVMRNFFTNFKGNAIYRTGLEDLIGEFQDCVLYEFLFRNDQNYIMVFYDTTVRFLTYASDGSFGWVLNGGSILEVSTPYTLDECRDLQFAQNGDVVIISHNSHAPKDLKRTSSDTFTIANHPFSGSPFSSPNWPKSSVFHKGRLYFSNTINETTTVWASEAGDFNEFTIPTEVTDISPLKFTLSEITQPIEWLFSGENSLIGGCAQGVIAINGGGINTAIKADSIEADLTPTDGSNSQIPLAKDSLIFYEGKNSRNVYYFSYDLLTESFKAKDANFLSYDITKGDIAKLRYKKDRDDLIYAVRNDGKWLSLNFQEEENIIGWHEHETFGKVRDIVVISDNDGNPQVFVLVDRNDGSFYIERLADHIEFTERSSFFSYDGEGDAKEAELADDDAHNRLVAEELTRCVYLDNSQRFNNLQEGNQITYIDVSNETAFSSAFSSAFGSGQTDGSIVATTNVFSSGDVGKVISYKTETGYEFGRFEITEYIDEMTVSVNVLIEPSTSTYDNWYLSFNSISGLTQYIGTTVGVVTDGGFLDKFEITSDTLELDREVLSVVVGYTYRGEIKSFGLGFQAKAENTQITMKAITQTAVRCVSTAGLKFGSSPYRMAPMQKLTQSDLNYLPPLPIDGTAFIDYTDDNKRDKFFYIVQDEPLPAIITGVFLNASYTIRQ